MPYSSSCSLCETPHFLSMPTCSKPPQISQTTAALHSNRSHLCHCVPGLHLLLSWVPRLPAVPRHWVPPLSPISLCGHFFVRFLCNKALYYYTILCAHNSNSNPVHSNCDNKLFRVGWARFPVDRLACYQNN
jgi:hypothetical protein